MKISIDSAEPLEDVMRVVGAMYGVTLAVTTPDTDAQPAASSTRGRGRARSKSRGKSPARRSSRSRSAGRSSRVSAAELRAWAQEHGHTVNDRGPIPADVRAAYQAAQGN